MLLSEQTSIDKKVWTFSLWKLRLGSSSWGKWKVAAFEWKGQWASVFKATLRYHRIWAVFKWPRAHRAMVSGWVYLGVHHLSSGRGCIHSHAFREPYLLGVTLFNRALNWAFVRESSSAFFDGGTREEGAQKSQGSSVGRGECKNRSVFCGCRFRLRRAINTPLLEPFK